MSQLPLLLCPQTEAGRYRWRLGERGGNDRLSDIAAHRDGEPVVLVLPAEEVLLRRLPLAPGERRHAAQSVPFMLEEELSEDISKLQVALAPPVDDAVVVAIVQRSELAARLSLLRAAQLSPILCVPEQQLLLRAQQGWGALAIAERIVVHSASGQSVICDAQNADELLALLAADSPPQSIRLRVDAGQSKAVIASFPKSLRKHIECLPSDAEDRLDDALVALAAGDVVNLLQGDFKLRLSWGELWGRWRTVALLIVANLLLYSAVSYSDLQRLQQRSEQLALAIAGVYGEFFAEAERRVPQARADFERLLLDVTEQPAQRSYLLPLLDRVAVVLRQTSGAKLHALQYRIKDPKQLQVEVETSSFASAEKIRQLFDMGGLDAQMLGSNAVRNNRVRVRFQCSLREQAQ